MLESAPIVIYFEQNSQQMLTGGDVLGGVEGEEVVTS